MDKPKWLQKYTTANLVNVPWTEEDKQAAIDDAVKEITAESGSFNESVFHMCMRIQVAVFKEAEDCGKLKMLYDQERLEKGTGLRPEVLRGLGADADIHRPSPSVRRPGEFEVIKRAGICPDCGVKIEYWGNQIGWHDSPTCQSFADRLKKV